MDNPRLIVIAGPNGSGKTFLTSQILEHIWTEGCEYINPDTIAQERFGNWNSSDAVLKAAQYAQQRRYQCIAERKSLIFETVLSVQEKIDFLLSAKEKGYFIRLFFIGTNHPSINAARIVRRVIDGGHDVPIQKIIDRYYRSIKNCSLTASAIHRLYVYDNSVENENASLLFRSKEGQLVKQYAPINGWANEIFKAVNNSEPLQKDEENDNIPNNAVGVARE